ncbi:MAG: ATP-binding protein [Gemmatimonas sp.]|jgi:predicted AAA+ superfamily ATPase
MPTMLARKLVPPDASFLLFGARGTGKTTWIQQHFADAAQYDLLLANESLRLSRDPSLFRQECLALPDGAWIVVDEIQRVPALLDEVQHLMAKKRQRFVLSGSSARKLRRSGANLLAGRAEVRAMFPLVSDEVGDERSLDDVLTQGMLPLAVTGKRPAAFLKSYCDVYLREEVQAEALVRQIGPFARFLEVAARANAQTVNVSNIARDTGIARQTAQEFFQILVDTLLANWLPAWKLKKAIKQVAAPKFYLFDSGVARHLAGTSHLALTGEERGFLLETYLLHELRAWLHYQDREDPIAYWKTYDGVEVDFVVETKKGLIAIEVKSGERWDSRWNRGLEALRERAGGLRAAYGVFTGARALQQDGVLVLPWRQFLQRLWRGELLD